MFVWQNFQPALQRSWLEKPSTREPLSPPLDILLLFFLPPNLLTLFTPDIFFLTLRSQLVNTMSTEQTIDSNHDSAEVCIRRLSRKLSEVEIVMTTQEGKANQMKKERDAERSENEQLKKEVRRLNNELLKEKTISAALIKRNCKEENDKEITDGKQENGNLLRRVIYYNP